jgi:hypothetical protein
MGTAVPPGDPSVPSTGLVLTAHTVLQLERARRVQA